MVSYVATRYPPTWWPCRALEPLRSLSCKRLAKSANNFILCFDGDAGGKSAAEKFIQAAGPMAKTGEIQINVAQLPQGKDPDEICREEGVDLSTPLTDAMPWLDWVIDFWAASLDKTNTQHVTEVEKALRQEVNGLQSNAVRAHYIDKIRPRTDPHVRMTRRRKLGKPCVLGRASRVVIEKREWDSPPHSVMLIAPGW